MSQSYDLWICKVEFSCSNVRRVESCGFILSFSQSFGLIGPLLQGLHGPVAQGSWKQNRPSRSWETWDSMKCLECLGCFTVCFVLKCDFILWFCCHSLKENICGLEASFWLLLTDEMPSDAEVKVRICDQIRDWKVNLSVLQTRGTCGTFFM